MIRLLKKINTFILTIEELVAKILLLVIVVFVFIAALLRWFRIPVVWSIDLAQLLFVWVCFFGADIALEKERHIGIDMIVRNLPGELQKAIKLMTYTIIIAFLLFIIYWGIQLGFLNMARQYSGLEISYSWATFSAPVGCLLMLRTSIIKIILLFRNTKSEQAGTNCIAEGQE